MALSKNRLGDAIWAAVKTVYGPYSPAMGAGFETQGRDLWRAVAGEIISEFDANADIVLANADIHVSPGTFKDSLNAPVTGQAEIVGVTLTGKLA